MAGLRSRTLFAPYTRLLPSTPTWPRGDLTSFAFMFLPRQQETIRKAHMTTAELVIDELRTITQGELQRIRQADGLVSVYDWNAS